MSSSFLSSLSPEDRFALVFAALLALLVGVVIGRRRAERALWAAAFLPAPIVALVSPTFDFVGWHGFMHASPVFQLMVRGGTVPEDPLFAGGTIRYPWVEYWVLAHGANLTGLSPLVLALVVQTLAFALFLFAAGAVAATLTRDRFTVAIAVLLSAYGVSIFHGGLFAAPLERALPPLWLETRVVPVDKFLNLTAAPLGYAALATFAAVSVRIAARRGDERRQLVAAAAATLVAVFFHPLSWLGILVHAGAVAGVVGLQRDRASLARAARLLLAAGLPSLAALPYLRGIGLSESSDGFSGVTPSAALLGAKAADLAFFLATPLLLTLLDGRALGRRLRERDGASRVLVGILGSCAIAYLALRLPGRNEYKLLLAMVPAAAALMAPPLRALLARRRWVGLVLLLLLVLPGGRILGSRPWFRVTDPARLDGRFLRAVDPDADALYRYVAEQTPVDAVFLAADLRVPPLGRRSLYIAVDAPWRGRDGWGLPRNSLLQWHIRRPDAVMYRRQHLATIVLNPDWARPPATVMAAIAADVPGRPLFVHAHTPRVEAKLDATPGFERRFGNRAGAVYAYVGGDVDR
jgi:hypothetical protein